MRGADKDEIIKGVLKETPKTPKELLHECLERGLERPTYYNHLKKLIKIGEVKDAKYELIEKEKEADPEIIRDCIQIIRSDAPDEIRVARAEQLNRLCNWRRTAYSPDLLNFLETSVNDQNETVRKRLVLALVNMLLYEQRRKPREYRIIKRIIDKNIGNMAWLASKDRSIEVRASVLRFLGYTGDVRALHPIFEIIKNCDQEEYERLKEWVHVVLFTPEYLLTEKLRREVAKRLDQLLIDSDEDVKKRAKELHKFMVSPSGMQ